jgi:hypothetical protein
MFDALPDELLLLVFDYIQDDYDDLPTFHALNTTSQRLRRLTIEYLYSKFHGQAPEQFLRTIALPHSFASPEIGDHVKEVVWYQNYWTGTARQRCLSMEDRRLLANKLRSSGRIVNASDSSGYLPDRFLNFYSERETHWWYLEFFLLFTPKVQRLHVWDTWQWDDHFYWFETISANSAHFGNLQSITLHGPLRLENVVPLLTLPSIRQLELTQVITMRQELGRAFSWQSNHGNLIENRLDNGSSLEILVMRESDIFFPQAVVILERLNKLKSLTYEYASNELASHPAPWHEFPHISELRRLSGTPLEHLRIRSEDRLEKEVVSSFLPPKFMSENHPLQNLRSLDIGPCDLPGLSEIRFVHNEDGVFPDPKGFVERLPDMLEVLHINMASFYHDYEFCIDDLFVFLTAFAKTIASSSHNLKRVAIVERPVLANFIPAQEAFSDLQELFSRLGMDFDIISEEIEY